MSYLSSQTISVADLLVVTVVVSATMQGTKPISRERKSVGKSVPVIVTYLLKKDIPEMSGPDLIYSKSQFPFTQTAGMSSMNTIT